MAEPIKTPEKTEEETVERASESEIAEEEGEGSKGKFSLGKYSPIIMPALMALAISFFLVNIMAVPKGTYNNAVAGLNSRMVAIELSIGNLEGLPESVAIQIQDIQNDMDNFEPNDAAINSLATKINSLEAQVAGLNIPSGSSITAIIDNRIAQYEIRLNDLEEDLAALQEGEDEEEPPSLDEITVWTKEFFSTPELDIDYTISPSRVEDEEDYIIMVYLLNYEPVVKSNVVVDIIFSPKTGDRVKVDEDEIYLDSTRTPFYAWFSEVVKRSDGTVRRMVFTSEKMSIDASTGTLVSEGGSGIYPGRITLRLEFTLAYE